MDLLTGYGAFHWCASWATPALDVFFRVVTDIGSHTFYYLVCAPLFWVVDRRKASTLFLLVLVSALVNTVAKLGFHTPRPDPNLARVLDLRPFQSGNPSFPSGHTQGALVFWSFLAWWAGRRWITACCVAMIVLISFSRIYLGAHFPIDVLGGFVLGALTLAFLPKPLLRWSESDFRGYVPACLTAMVLVLGGTVFTRDPSMALLTGCFVGFFVAAVWLPQPELVLTTRRQRIGMILVGIVAIAPMAKSLESSLDSPLRLVATVTALWIISLWLYPHIVARVIGSASEEVPALR